MLFSLAAVLHFFWPETLTTHLKLLKPGTSNGDLKMGLFWEILICFGYNEYQKLYTYRTLSCSSPRLRMKQASLQGYEFPPIPHFLRQVNRPPDTPAGPHHAIIPHANQPKATAPQKALGHPHRGRATPLLLPAARLHNLLPFRALSSADRQA